VTRTAEPNQQTAWSRLRTRAAAMRQRGAAVRERVRAKPGGRLAWRIGATVVGVAIIAGGVVLLPLPGPGWLIIFAGLGVLATEYSWASRLLGWLRDQVTRWSRWIARQPRGLQVAVGLVGILLVGAIIAGVWYLYRRI